MTPHRARPLIAALATLPLVVSGCNPFAGPDPDVRVVISSARFEFEEPVTFEVRNDLDRVVVLYACDGNPWVELLQHVDGEWTSVAAPDCAAIYSSDPIELEPGDRVRGFHPGRHLRGLYGLSLPYTSYERRASGGFGVATIGNAKSEPFHITR
ncbi:MAG: hypothetical protein R3195_14965 [Gemmatimonadota bacterium]|nr:hypothetical protein [Gemmatimonadota bacterium]